jgi:Tfp pilus assembly protein PilV
MTKATDRGDAGFWTLEVLVAFLVLSLGLALSVQSISQASLSDRQAESRGDRHMLLRKVVSEELPAVIDAYSGGVRTFSGPSWRIELRPMALEGGSVAARVTVALTGVDGKDLPEMHVQIVPMIGTVPEN